MLNLAPSIVFLRRALPVARIVSKNALKQKTLVNALGSTDGVVQVFEYLIDTQFVTGVALDVNYGEALGSNLWLLEFAMSPSAVGESGGALQGFAADNCF